jgi:hypothetical protein
MLDTGEILFSLSVYCIAPVAIKKIIMDLFIFVNE